MVVKFKTLNFVNNKYGQKQKVKALQKEVAKGWEIVTETITPGKFKGDKACCTGALCLPTALCAGSTDGFINITLKRDQ